MNDYLPNRGVFSAHMKGDFDEGPTPTTVFVSSVLHLDLKEIRKLVKKPEYIELINYYAVLIYLVNPPQAGQIDVESLEKSDSRTELLEILLQAGADPNITFGPQKYTPLHFCCDQYYLDSGCVNLLLKYGANVMLKDTNGNTALHKLVDGTVTHDSLDIANALIQKDPEIKKISNEKGETPFAHKFAHYAGSEDELSVLMETLLSTDVFDERALINAINYGYKNSVKRMCEKFRINKKYVSIALSAEVPQLTIALSLQEQLSEQDKIRMTESEINELFEKLSRASWSRRDETLYNKFKTHFMINSHEEATHEKATQGKATQGKAKETTRQSRREGPYGGVGRRKRTSKTQKRKGRR